MEKEREEERRVYLFIYFLSSAHFLVFKIFRGIIKISHTIYLVFMVLRMKNTK